MMNRIRQATPEEVKSIEAVSDLQGCAVWALDTPSGVALAVIRTAVEVDPVIYPEGLSDRMKAMFQRDIETTLFAQGVSAYYFNVHVDNQPMLDVAKTLGAVEQSTAPEIRFKKVL